MTPEPTYDQQGRMKYHPDYHQNQGKPWTSSDQKYLIECYEQLGPEQISFALGRTITTVMQRASVLRKQGEMPMPTKRVHHRRIGAQP